MKKSLWRSFSTCPDQEVWTLNRLRLLVMDDYEGELAKAPAMDRLRRHAGVTILNRPIAAGDLDFLKGFQILLALRERTTMDKRFFNACPDLELVLQTGGHAYHLDQEAATRRGIVVALGRRVTKSRVAVPELVFGLLLGLIKQIYPLELLVCDLL